MKNKALILATLALGISACSTQQDTLGYVEPPAGKARYSNEPSNLNQTGGILTSVDAEQASPSDALITLRE